MRKAIVQVGTTGIPDIAILKSEGKLDIIDTDHPMVSVNCFNDIENLFIGGMSHISKIKNWDEEYSVDDIVNMICDNCTFYKHHYEEGDMLVWDNI
jgi:alpha-ketoglutarate-dependent taurine dioxygenase